MYTWDDSLSIGNEVVDKQHKELLETLDRLLLAMKEGKGRNELMYIIAFLERYAEEHFYYEEKLQRMSSYPKCIEHEAKHEEFRFCLKEIKEELLNRGASIALTIKLKNELVNWLKTHIAVVDKELAQYITNQKS